MPTADETRLDDLKQRWARDPGSRLYLQLADEHRKLGQLEEAESVLIKGLENRPSDLSGLVALGRVALELDKLDEAQQALESVVGRDPAHIVANKLLLEVQLQREDAEKAGQRLDICRLLNDRDPELEHLERRLQQLRADPQATAGPVEVVLEEEMPAVEAVEPVAAYEAAEAPAAEAVAAAPLEPAMPEPPAEPPAESPEPAMPTTAQPESRPAAEDEIFHLVGEPPPPGLDSLWASPRSIEPFGALTPVASFAEGDVFSFPAPVSTAAPAAEPGRDSGLPPPDAAGELTEPVAVRTQDGEDAAGPTIHEELTEAAIEDEVLLDTRKTRLVPPAAVVEAAAEPGPGRPEEEVLTEVPTRKVTISAWARKPVVGDEPAIVAPAVGEPAIAEAEAGEEEVATVALGGLYLRQGHLEEAARIFTKVLEHDPDNHAARAGLNLATKPKQGERLTAKDLLADRSLTGAVPAGLTTKKLLVLTNYLAQIRAGRNREDVR